MKTVYLRIVSTSKSADRTIQPADYAMKGQGMAKLKLVALTLVGFALGFVGTVDVYEVSSPSELALPFALKISEANARGGRAVRTTRRVARRTTRRVIRRSTLPHSCVWHSPFYYCGGVYYQPVVQSGVTVYIVVYP